jgi:hypothetical protein
MANETLSLKVVERPIPGIISSYAIEDAGGAEVASFFPYRRMVSPDGKTGGYALDYRALRVAELMAAAPDLYDALRNLLAANGGGAKDCGHAYTCICPEQQARAALAKAEIAR